MINFSLALVKRFLGCLFNHSQECNDISVLKNSSFSVFLHKVRLRFTSGYIEQVNGTWVAAYSMSFHISRSDTKAGFCEMRFSFEPGKIYVGIKMPIELFLDQKLPLGPCEGPIVTFRIKINRASNRKSCRYISKTRH